MFADRLGGERFGDPMRTLILFDEAAFLQAPQHVAHHCATNVEMFGKLSLDQAITPENKTGRDVVFHRLVNAFPGAAVLQSVVDGLGDGEPKFAQVDSGRLGGFIRARHHEAAAVEAPDEALRLQPQQRRLDRRATGLHQRCDRPFQQHQARRNVAAENVLAQHLLDHFVTSQGGLGVGGTFHFRSRFAAAGVRPEAL